MKKWILVLGILWSQEALAQPDSLDIKIGQMILFGFNGTVAHPNSPIYKAIESGKLGGILLFSRNIPAKNTRKSLIQLTRAFQEAAPLPLFISIDQEGGRVSRLPVSAQYPSTPSARNLGLQNDSLLTYKYAARTGSNLRQAGLNLNFAPVADIHQASNPVIGKLNRAYSANTSRIRSHVKAVINGHLSECIIPVVKHFPGHGSSRTDSHKGITDISKTWKEAELNPYRQLIADSLLPAIMTGHVINTQLDVNGLPATLSSEIITGLLREKMGFNGVVFSDDLLMHAISKNFTLDNTILLAINAGVDVLLFGNIIPGPSGCNPVYVHQYIRSLVDRKIISPERVEASFTRIQALKNRFLPEKALETANFKK